MNDWHAYVRIHLPPLPVTPAREQEIIDELAQQLEQACQDALAAGATERAARIRAESQIADWPALARDLAKVEAPMAARVPTHLHEALDARHLRSRRGGNMAADLTQDLRYALRGLRRAPGFALVAVLTLALGIGANTAIFALVEAVVLRPLPFPQPQRLVAVLETSAQFPQMAVSFPNYLDWRDDNHVFTQLAAVRGADMILTHLGEPSMVLGRRVTANYFAMLGVAPALGRTFLPAEDRGGAPDVVVVSAAFFRERLGANPHWLGRTINLDGRDRTIVGVMPPGFPGLMAAGSEPQFWTPLGAAAAQDASLMQRGNHAGILVLGRLRPGIDLSQARANLAAVAHALAQQYPKTNAGNTVAMQPYIDLIVGDARPALLLLLAAVGLVLLIACANTANLVLARAAARQKAEAIRAALGATRARLLRQHLVEGLCLGTIGCGAGLLLAAAVLRVAPALGSALLPRATQLSLDSRVLGFTVLLALATGIACGLAPALQIRDARLADILKEGGQSGAGGHRLREFLVGCEIALALLLLMGAGLLVRSLVRLQGADPGFHARGVLTFIVGLPEVNYPGPARQREFFRQAMARLAGVPGVAAVGGVYPLPLSGNDWEEPFLLVGRPAPAPGHEPSTDVAEVRGDYFGAMGMRLLRGRAFQPTDDALAAPVAIVDDAFAASYFPGPQAPQRALGRQINLDGVQRTIVGIVAHVRNRGLAGAARAETYIPQDQSEKNAAALFFVLRSAAGDPRAQDTLALSLRSPAIAQIQATDARQPVTDVETMDQRIDFALAPSRRILGLMGAFAALALALAVVGIYGVISYAVAERTHEIGIRMALGAGQGRLLAMVVGQGLRLAGAGAIAGLALALPLGPFLGAFLYGIAPADPLTLLAVPALVLALAAMASYIPARRAARVDPLRALHAE